MKGRQQSHQKLEEVPSAIIPRLPPRQQPPELRLWCIGLVLLLVQSCGLFRKVEKGSVANRLLVNNDTKLKQFDLMERKRERSVLAFSRDSTEMEYQLQIWPKGKFRFSAQNGFEGEAERVLVIKKMQRVDRAIQHSRIQENVKEEFQKDLKLKQVVKTSNNVKSITKSVSWKWLVAGLFLFGLTFIYLYRKFFKNK